MAGTKRNKKKTNKGLIFIGVCTPDSNFLPYYFSFLSIHFFCYSYLSATKSPFLYELRFFSMPPTLFRSSGFLDRPMRAVSKKKKGEKRRE